MAASEPDPQAKRSRRALTPSGPRALMTLPHSDRGRFAVGERLIEQPVMTLRAGAAEPRAFPDDFLARAATQRAALEASITPAKTRVHQVKHFAKIGGNQEPTEALGDAHLGGLAGANQNGRVPGDAALTRDSLPAHADLTHHRPAQMLSQLSEVLMHGAQRAGLALDPVEIQFGYGINEHGHIDVFASANNPETQAWLQTAMTAPAGAHLEAAANAEDPEIANIGAKLLFHGTQQERRQAAIAGHPDEAGLQDDLALADVLRDKFLRRDITVVTNASGNNGRHAEQNIGVAMHQGDYQVGDIQGTKIRCHSCRAGLGANLREDDAAQTGLSGKIYASQAGTGHFDTSFQEIAAHREKIVTASPQRPRSGSLASIPALPAAAPVIPAAAPALPATAPPPPPAAGASHQDGEH